jgi:hypothetical protein
VVDILRCAVFAVPALDHAAYRGDPSLMVLGFLHQAVKTGELGAMEQAAHHEHGGVDDAPGEVAADRRHDDVAGGDAVEPCQHAGAEREGQEHDQAENDLAQALAGLEITLDECFDHDGPLKIASGRHHPSW